MAEEQTLSGNVDIFTTAELDEIHTIMSQSTNTNEEDINTKTTKLELPKNIINGIIPIKIVNLDDMIENIDWSTTYIICKVLYKLNLPSTNKNGIQPIPKWQSTDFWTVSQTNYFWFKVPLFLLPYTFTFALSISFINRSMNTEIKYSPDKLHSLEIPSILIDNKEFNKGDAVTYSVENASFVRSGVITKVSNDMITIKINAYYFAEDTEEEAMIVTVHKSRVSRDSIKKLFIVDITDKNRAYNDMITRNNDMEKYGVFSAIVDGLKDIYIDKLWHDDELIDDYEECDAVWIPQSVAVYIYGFLFIEQYNHRVCCIFDGKEMLYEKQWAYDIEATRKDYINGRDPGTDNVQESWDPHRGYSCDICRVELSYFEYMWHCTNTEHKHDFCLTCIHSMVEQYTEMQEFLMEILEGVVNKDCVEQIVVFCVGKINKFVV